MEEIDFNDRKLVIELAKKYPNILLHTSNENIKNDREIVEEAVKSNGEVLKYASKELRNDKKIVLEAIKNNKLSLKYASNELKNDKDFILEAIKSAPLKSEVEAEYTSFIGEDLKKDKEIVFEFARRGGHIEENLKNSITKEMCIEDIKAGGTKIFEILSKNKKLDRDFMLRAIEQNSELCKYLPEDLITDNEIFKKVVLAEPKVALHWMNQKGIDKKIEDREIALKLLNIEEFEPNKYISSTLFSGPDFAKEAVKINYRVFYNLPDYLKNNKEIVEEAIKKFGGNIEYVDKSLVNDNLVLEAINTYGKALAYGSNELKESKEIVLSAIEQDGEALKYASNELKNNKEIVLKAIERNEHALEYASEELKKDKKIIIEAIDKNPNVLQYVDEKFKNDKEIILKAVKKEPHTIKYASKELIGKSFENRGNKEFLLKVIKEQPKAFNYIPENYKDEEGKYNQEDYKEYALKAVENGNDYILYKIAKERHNSGGKNYFENGENEFLKEAINIAIKRDIEEIKEARANKENSVDEIKKSSKTEEQNIPEKVETIKPLTKESIINGINPREGEIIKFTKAIKELKLNERANEQNQKENIDFEK